MFETSNKLNKMTKSIYF